MSVSAIQSKRTYTVATFRTAVDEALVHLDDIRAAHRSERVDKAFAERIMLAVTQVNQCRYCQYAHARGALAAGLTDEEIERLSLGEFDSAPPEQRVALLFAEHYAETAGHPDQAARQKLLDTYGPDAVRDILAYIRMIMIGNLSGNTVEAFIGRIKGKPTIDSSLRQELGVLLGSLIIIPAGIIRHKWRRR